MAMEEEDLYAVLHLNEGGPHLVHAVIRKAYRKRALELHPDKCRDNPVAAEKFHKLQRAYNILNDEKARASYDEVQRVRKARVHKLAKVQNEKRQQMMRDLARKEQVHKREQEIKSQKLDEVHRRLKEEIARITKARGRKYRGPSTSSSDPGEASRSNQAKSADLGKSASVRVEVPPAQSSAASDTKRILIVSWTCLEDSDAWDYSPTRLKDIFEAFGVVENMVFRTGKSFDMKRHAMVVMSIKEAALKATEAVCGDPWNPLLVVPFIPELSG